MTTDAILWAPHPDLYRNRVAGMSVLERQLHTLARAGLRRVWVSADRPADPPRPPRGMEVFWSSQSSGAAPQCQTPYLVVSGSHFIRVETLAHIVRRPGCAHAAFTDSRQATVIQVVTSRGEEVSPAQAQPLPEGSCLRLSKPLDADAVTEWLLSCGPKAQDGFMARHFDRHLSLAVSRMLLDTPVTPNMMTVFSCLVGLAGAAFFLVHAAAAHVAGAVLVWLHSVLDGCDGELARIRFAESELGADIDFWGDNLVHVALFGCMALGFARADRSVMPLLAGACAIVGIVGSAVLVYRQRLARRRSPPEEDEDTPSPASWLSRVETILEQRDFIYLLLLLAYLDIHSGLGWTYAFLWAGAVGAVLFFFLTLYLDRIHRSRRLQNEPTFQPHSAG